ncbi:MAG: hypothetical protein HUU32_00775 [Calditrichaceae bacterium]|nr:hypothetical protein [Calditrichia bacterium]NUQ39906.1 hypothetical protein [Calditrichaceae bacterium]
MKWQEWLELARNEAFWEGHEERGLLKAEYIRDYVLRLWFEEAMDVSIYELDFYPLIMEEEPGEVLLALRDKKRFQLVEGNYALIWPNPETGAYDEKAIDIAPECIRFFCEKYGKKLKVSNKSVVGHQTPA